MIRYTEEMHNGFRNTETTVMEKPAFVKEEHLILLNAIDESSATNMFVAVPYLLENDRDLNPQQAQAVLRFWLSNYQTASESVFA